MQLTISITAPGTPSDQALLNLEVSDSLTIADLKALINAETTLPVNSQHLYHNGQLLADAEKSLEGSGIKDGDILAMHVRDMTARTARAPNSSSAGQASATQQSQRSAESAQRGGFGGRGAPQPDPEVIRLQILGDPEGRERVRAQNPDLADAVEDSEQFRRVFFEIQRKREDADRARQHEIALLNEDPFNPEAQAKIEELIRQEAVTENLQNALEHNPEAFGRVHMLYIDVEVNGHKVKAFVDSGAQATIMSPSCAEACGIMRLVDKRFAGIARGVGTAKIIGRVHSAQIRIGSLYLACSFTVMEGKDVDLLLGLDMLKRHQASIDLKQNKLIIQDTEVPFLGEADIPKSEEEQLLNEPTVEGPGGAKVGARSGAVMQTVSPTPAAGGAGPSAQSANFQGQGQTVGAGGGNPSSSAPSTFQAPAPAVPATAPEATYPAEAIQQLQQLGFSRQEAIDALNATGGNVDYAAGLLFQER